jgi:hypothetical protein
MIRKTFAAALIAVAFAPAVPGVLENVAHACQMDDCHGATPDDERGGGNGDRVPGWDDGGGGGKKD